MPVAREKFLMVRERFLSLEMPCVKKKSEGKKETFLIVHARFLYVCISRVYST